MLKNHKWGVRDHVKEWIQEKYRQIKAERERAGNRTSPDGLAE